MTNQQSKQGAILSALKYRVSSPPTNEKAIMYPKDRHVRTKAKRLDQFYVIKLKNDRYMYRLGGRSYRYGWQANYAKQFKTEKDAIKWLEQYNIIDRFGVECEIEYIDTTANMATA